jgi:cytochrome bd ubiquinol oxidase subunit I
VPLVLFAWPDEARAKTAGRSIPNGASLILKHSADGVVPGLNDFVGEHPPVAPVFSLPHHGRHGPADAGAFLGRGPFLWRRGTLPRPLFFAFAGMAFSGWIATLAGWYTTEIGRQPWLVQGVLMTADAVADLPGSHVAFTVAGYVILYVILLVVYLGVLTYLALKAARDGDTSPLPQVEDRPMSQPVQPAE